MLIFFTDESYVYGQEMEQYGLSIYGGLILDKTLFRDLTNFLYDLKERYFLPQKVELKWRYEMVWDEMRRFGPLSKEVTKKTHPDIFETYKHDYNKLKEEILDKVAGSKAKIVVAIRPNRLLNASLEEKVRYSLEAVCRKFEKILQSKNDLHGLVLADELVKRLKDEETIDYEYILNLCYDGSGSVSMDRVISVIPTINSRISPIHQINDILLGAIQYYSLEFMRTLKDESWDMKEAKRLFSKFVGNFYKSSTGSYTINNGILFYPPKNSRQATKAGIFLDKLEAKLKEDFGIN